MHSFPKGTLITLGQSKGLRPEALGVVFKVDNRLQGGRYEGKVLEAPNGWEHDRIRHKFVPSCDTYRRPEDASNADGKSLLKKEYADYE